MQLLSPSETTSIPGTLIRPPPPPNSPLRVRVRDVNNNIGRFGRMPSVSWSLWWNPLLYTKKREILRRNNTWGTKSKLLRNSWKYLHQWAYFEGFLSVQSDSFFCETRYYKTSWSTQTSFLRCMFHEAQFLHPSQPWNIEKQNKECAWVSNLWPCRLTSPHALTVLMYSPGSNFTITSLSKNVHLKKRYTRQLISDTEDIDKEKRASKGYFNKEQKWG